MKLEVIITTCLMPMLELDLCRSQFRGLPTGLNGRVEVVLKKLWKVVMQSTMTTERRVGY